MIKSEELTKALKGQTIDKVIFHKAGETGFGLEIHTQQDSYLYVGANMHFDCEDVDLDIDISTGSLEDL